MSARKWFVAVLLGLSLCLPAPGQDKPGAAKGAATKPAVATKPTAPGDKKPEMKKEGDRKGEMKKDENKDEPKEKKKETQYRSVGTLTGRIAQIGEGGSTFTLRVQGTMPTWIQTYDYRFGRWRTVPNYNRPNVVTNDVDVIMADDVKVRIPPKLEYDEKGRPKPPPKKDPKEDPDHKLPGYKGEASDLAKDQIVTVQFGVTTDPKNPQVLATHVFVQQEAKGYKGDDK